MVTSDANPISPDVLADMQAVADTLAAGKPLDSEVALRSPRALREGARGIDAPVRCAGDCRRSDPRNPGRRMRYVLDSSIALKWVLAEPDSAKAKQLRDDFRRHIHDLLAPDIFQVEVAHALTRAERQGRIASAQAGVFWADIMSTSPRLEPSGPLIPRADSESPPPLASASTTASMSL